MAEQRAQVDQYMKMLDEMAENDPEAYKQFINQQMQEKKKMESRVRNPYFVPKAGERSGRLLNTFCIKVCLSLFSHPVLNFLIRLSYLRLPSSPL